MSETSPEIEARGTGALGALRRRRAALGHGLGFAWKPAAGAGDYLRVFPFRRHWMAIGLLAVFDVVFLLPAISTFGQAVEAWGSANDLFGLTSALFLTAWLLGWSLAPLAMTLALAVLLFGREVVTARRGLFELYLGLPLLGVSMRYDPRHLRRMRLETPAAKSGKSWRGSHGVADYGEETVSFGIDVSPGELAQMRSSIEVATGVRIEDRDATPDELAAIAAQRGGDARAWPLVEAPPDESRPTLHAGAGQSSAAASAGAPAPSPTQPLTLTSPSALALIAANLVPLAGAVFFGWALSDVMVLYWAETAVVGVWNLARMWAIGRWLAIPAGIFFVGHFGAFMAVHFLFLWTIFVQGPSGLSGDAGGGGDLREVAAMFGALAPALLALFVSHGFSFFSNFLGRREFVGRKLGDQMGEPYRRVVFMHLVLIFGGGLALVLGEPTLIIIGVIALKIAVDLRAHLKQHGTADR